MLENETHLKLLMYVLWHDCNLAFMSMSIAHNLSILKFKSSLEEIIQLGSVFCVRCN